MPLQKIPIPVRDGHLFLRKEMSYEKHCITKLNWGVPPGQCPGSMSYENYNSLIS